MRKSHIPKLLRFRGRIESKTNSPCSETCQRRSRKWFGPHVRQHLSGGNVLDISIPSNLLLLTEPSMNSKVLRPRSDSTGCDYSCNCCIILIDSDGFIYGMANRQEKVTKDFRTFGCPTIRSNFRIGRMERDRSRFLRFSSDCSVTKSMNVA